MSSIRTKFDPPPIPDRQFDWSAMHEPDNSDGRHVGWGRTEAEALEDLARLDQEREESEMDQDRWEYETGVRHD